MLYPRESESRELRSLCGIWKFKIDPANSGLNEGWYDKPLPDTIEMAVPASYNDLSAGNDLRRHIGLAWYERTFFVSPEGGNRRLVLRFGSVTHEAHVYINGKFCRHHKGGFLPFEAEIGSLVVRGGENRLTVAVDNRLSWQSLPAGEVKTINDDCHPPGYQLQEYHFDFFNYAGIHRPVCLYTTPLTWIDDISTTTRLGPTGVTLGYEIEIKGPAANAKVELIDATGVRVAGTNGTGAELEVSHPNLWEPGNGYLYTLKVEATDAANGMTDVYRLPVGLRTVRVAGKQILVNEKPVYFKGFGKHEDSDFRGRGFDAVVALQDVNLLKWVGANSYRTSHYPYAEEHMQLADRHGILIIDELPAVGMHFFTRERKIFTDQILNDSSRDNHIETLRELIRRDKNHPSVVMWSIANEAATYEEGARAYFKPIIDEARRLDPSRPLTIAHCPLMDECNVADLVDVLCLNRYYAWYFDPGRTELIEPQLEKNLRKWFARYGKPIIVSEYGADTVAGLHHVPPIMFSEEFQAEFLRHYHNVFDRLDFVVGEHVWNFADFSTKEGLTRVGGNLKGVFTRQRQPKMAAHLLRERWTGKGAGPKPMHDYH